MRLSRTLFLYFGRQFLLWFVAILAGLLFIILLFEVVELLRRAAKIGGVPFATVVQMGLLKLPETAQKIIPFSILFGAMFGFWKLTRSHELVVVRAAGVSVWQFLAPPVAVALLIGITTVTLVNPVSAVLSARFDRMEARHLRGQDDAFVVSGNGLWLREVRSDGSYSVVRADAVDARSQRLQGVALLEFDAGGRFVDRLDATEAELQPGQWLLRQVWRNAPGKATERLETLAHPTELTLQRIQENFAPPDTLSFWDLPHFIATLEASGFSALSHRLHYQTLLALPLLLAAMVLLAAPFSLRNTRHGGASLLIGGGIATGFVLFVMNDIVQSLGASEVLPVVMAAWAPTAISLMAGGSALLHQEDG
ncbi:MAG TPA: LPS export ABC transporter permease LptG [Alphaproteobacteria bacterium]|nr:LPS export ABC transporter permease LptG [Alphaproteobacteria bacterium]